MVCSALCGNESCSGVDTVRGCVLCCQALVQIKSTVHSSAIAGCVLMFELHYAMQVIQAGCVMACARCKHVHSCSLLHCSC